MKTEKYYEDLFVQTDEAKGYAEKINKLTDETFKRINEITEEAWGIKINALTSVDLHFEVKNGDDTYKFALTYFADIQFNENDPFKLKFSLDLGGLSNLIENEKQEKRLLLAAKLINEGALDYIKKQVTAFVKKGNAILWQQIRAKQAYVKKMMNK